MLVPRGLLRVVAGATLLMSATSPAWGQAGDALTLPEALARAEAHAPALAEARAAVDAARGRTRQAGARPNPEARLEVENVSGSGLYAGLDLAETTLAVGQTIEMGGKRQSRIAAGNAEVVAAETREMIAHVDLELEVRRLFAIALASREQVALARGALDRARDLARAAQTLVDAGRDPPLRALRARAAAAEAEAGLQHVLAEDAAARSALASLLGDTTAPATVAGAFETLADAPRFIDPVEALDVRLALAEAESARAIVARERAAASADVTAELGVRRFEDSRDTAVVFGLSMPIPVFDRNRGAIAAASADLNAANARRLRAMAETVRRMNDADSLLRAAQLSVATLESSAVPAASEALRLARAGYEAGRFTLLDVLDAEEALASAQSALIDARRDRANAAAALSRAVAR